MTTSTAAQNDTAAARRLGTAFLGFLASTFAISAIMVLLAQA